MPARPGSTDDTAGPVAVTRPDVDVIAVPDLDLRVMRESPTAPGLRWLHDSEGHRGDGDEEDQWADTMHETARSSLPGFQSLYSLESHSRNAALKS